MAASWLKFSISTSEVMAPAVAAHLIETNSFCKDGVSTEESQDSTRICFWTNADQKEEALKAVEGSLASLQSLGLPINTDHVTVEDGGVEEDWRHAWKKFFKTTRLTKRIVVVPSWESFSPDKNDIVIHLDPGMAFGTGAHASTQLVLNHMEELHQQGHVFKHIADVGCGTGILSIAGGKFWPNAEIYANDIDDEALKATLENADNNDTATQINVSLDLHDQNDFFDLTLANIQAHILIDMSSELLQRSREKSFTILSGILTKQIENVKNHFQSNGYTVLSTKQSELDPEWSSVMLKGGC